MRLFVRHERDLRVFARSMLPNWPAVDDVLQEASVVMWKKLHQLEKEEDFPENCLIAPSRILKNVKYSW